MAEIKSSTHYYPFGMQIEEYSFTPQDGGYRYGFNGMEREDEHTQEKYDFGARIYDSRLGRWLSVDPEYEMYPSVAPYAFAINSPIYYYDADGGVVYGTDGKPITVSATFDSDGHVTYTINGSPDDNTRRILESMMVTPKGVQAVQTWLDIEAEVRLELVNKNINKKGRPLIKNCFNNVEWCGFWEFFGVSEEWVFS